MSRTVVLCLDLSLHSIFVSPYSVFMCWLFAASSAIFSTRFLLSAHAFTLLLTSLSFSGYFGLSCLLTLSDLVLRTFLLISSLWSTRFHDSFLIHGFFLFRGLPRTLSTTSVYSFSVTWKPRSISSSSSTTSPSSSSYLVSALLRAMLNAFKMFSFFSLVVSYLTLIPFCSLFGSSTPI